MTHPSELGWELASCAFHVVPTIHPMLGPWVCAEEHTSTSLPQPLLGLTLNPWFSGKGRSITYGQTLCVTLHSGDFCELFPLSGSGYQFRIGNLGCTTLSGGLSDCRQTGWGATALEGQSEGSTVLSHLQHVASQEQFRGKY